MSSDTGMQEIRILGDGCAALSLAARANELRSQDHPCQARRRAPGIRTYLGLLGCGQPRYGEPDRLCELEALDHCHIEGKAELKSQSRPYFALRRSDWTKHCREAAAAAGVTVIDNADVDGAAQARTDPGQPTTRSAAWMHASAFYRI